MFLINSVVFYLLVLYLLPYSSSLIRHFLPLLLFFSFAINGGIISLPPAVSGIEHSAPLFIQEKMRANTDQAFLFKASFRYVVHVGYSGTQFRGHLPC